MLQELHVKDLALIEDVWLEFDPGMTVLTGETGAGKTALVGALKLLVGERADSQMVRAGTKEALVEGRFAVGGREMIARRRVSADGRSRCTLDDEMASVGTLAVTLGPLVDLHGQHEHQALLQPGRHVVYFDRVIGEDAHQARESYQVVRADHRAALDALQELRSRLDETFKKADYLRFVVQDIDSVDPVDGEDEALEARLPALRHGERLAMAASEAYALVRDDGGGSDTLAAACSALSRVTGIDPALDELRGRLLESAALVEQVGVELREYGDRAQHDPATLDMVEARAATIAGLKKKYGPTLGEVIEARRRASEALEALDAGEQGLVEAVRAEEEARAALEEAGLRLHELRCNARSEFARRLADEARSLAMEGARFEVAIEELPFERWIEDGPHRLEFLYAAGPGQPFRGLSRIASGGEISRVMLALKGVLGTADDVPILVFDEVDAGVGGATAVAVGQRLAALAMSRQVIVVTHLPQVAAHASRHLVVSKAVEEDGVHTSVVAVEGHERITEIARMLAGTGTDAGHAHAEELLDAAAASR